MDPHPETGRLPLIYYLLERLEEQPLPFPLLKYDVDHEHAGNTILCNAVTMQSSNLINHFLYETD